MEDPFGKLRINKEERLYWLGFSNFSGIGPGRFAKLLAAFGTAEKAWQATEKELLPVIKPALTADFLDFRKKFSLNEYEEKLYKAKVSFVILNDENYPPLLKQIKNVPFVLYYKARLPSLRSVVSGQGNVKILKQVQDDPSASSGQAISIGIVGTRRITDYGRTVTEALTADLVVQNCIIVSGLAMGVDSVAHQTTIENRGKTIAVLGCGVDCCYPRENQRLYEEILDSGGAVVSEYPLGQQPGIGTFPSRNRIIAGLSNGVVVTEGAADSGALITAKDAFAAGRKVFAVPGPITSGLSKGPYQLIKNGAIVVSSAKEIIDGLGIPTSPRLRGASKSIRGANKVEQIILDLLSEQDLHFDELIKRTKIDSKKLGIILSLMEMKGYIKTMSAGFFGTAYE